MPEPELPMQADDTPEFAEVLNAWQQRPPLTAEWVFDLPADDTRRADKVGVLMYQAVLMKQDHPDLDFTRIRAVTFTADVHRTGDELERRVGHDLPQFRNAAARLDVFHVNLGEAQILVVTDALANASLSPQPAVRRAAWELLRTELARTVAVARLASWTDATAAAERAGGASGASGAGGAGGASGAGGAGGTGAGAESDASARRWRSLARYTWTEYLCGLYAGVEGLQTPMARNRLREALEEDPVALAQAAQQFAQDADFVEFMTRAEGCLKGLFEAMAEVLGQLAASGASLSDTDPHLETLIHTHALGTLWDDLQKQLALLGTEPSRWQEASWFAMLIRLGQRYLAGFGLRYERRSHALDVAKLPHAPRSAPETP